VEAGCVSLRGVAEAPRPGLEPGTNRLTAGCSTIELSGNKCLQIFDLSLYALAAVFPLYTRFLQSLEKWLVHCDRTAGVTVTPIARSRHRPREKFYPARVIRQAKQAMPCQAGGQMQKAEVQSSAFQRTAAARTLVDESALLFNCPR